MHEPPGQGYSRSRQSPAEPGCAQEHGGTEERRPAQPPVSGGAKLPILVSLRKEGRAVPAVRKESRTPSRAGVPADPPVSPPFLRSSVSRPGHAAPRARCGARRGALHGGCPQTRTGPDPQEGPGPVEKAAGSDVLSHSVSGAVPSALRGLTTVFGMGTGVSPALEPPARQFSGRKNTGEREQRHRAPASRCGPLPFVGKPAKPLGRLVRLGSDARTPCTCRLSTSSSRTALPRACALGVLVLGKVSRLDAFSGSLVRT